MKWRLLCLMPKQNFNEKLTALLKTNRDFLDDAGELIPAAVRDHAWRLDHNLIRLLLTDDEIKAKFFDEIDGHWVFNHNTFINYIADKNFLVNSYTRFRQALTQRWDFKSCSTWPKFGISNVASGNQITFPKVSGVSVRLFQLYSIEKWTIEWPCWTQTFAWQNLQ